MQRGSSEGKLPPPWFSIPMLKNSEEKTIGAGRLPFFHFRRTGKVPESIITTEFMITDLNACSKPYSVFFQVPEMLKAMEEDAHINGIPECMSKRHAVDHDDVLPVESAMPATISQIDDLCSALGLPLLSRQHPLEGTITDAKVSPRL